jgi:hypothetical protein
MIAHSLPWLICTALPASEPESPQAKRLSTPKGYVCTKARDPVVIDGKPDEAAWADAAWTDDFVDIEGVIRPRPRQRTRARMLWDDCYFYVAAELDESHVWGTLTKHDSVIFQDNDFEVFIDPDGDNHEYYELEINALNTEWDLFLKAPYRDGGTALDAWEIPGLKTATHVNGTLNDPTDRDRSWTVEMAIPWSVLGVHAGRPAPPKDGDQWRVNFSRVEWQVTTSGKSTKKVPGTKEDNWVWSPQGVVDMHRPERWGYVQFSTAPPGTVTFRPDSSAPVRDRLIQIYEAQRRYFDGHKRWTTSLEDLDASVSARSSKLPAPAVKLKDKGYEASITLEGPPRRTWTIRQDSRLTVTEDAPGR